jgi:hypothetical protein
MANGGCECDDEPPPPVSLAVKLVALVLMAGLIIFPMFYLMAFGITVGKSTTHAWFHSTMFCMMLDLVIYEPLKIMLLNLALPQARGGHDVPARAVVFSSPLSRPLEWCHRSTAGRCQRRV